MKKNNILSILTALCLMGQILPAGQLMAKEDAETNDFIYGDINGDKVADLTDLSLLSIYLMGGVEYTDIQKKAADVDGNGENDIRDLAHFKRYICKDKVTLGPQNKSVLKLKQASNYEDVYQMMKNSSNNFYRNLAIAELDYSANTAAGGAVPTNAGNTSSDSENIQHSNTYNQEENVLESDIVKTDGNAIYTISRDFSSWIPAVKVVYVKDGKFETEQEIKLDLEECRFGTAYSPYVQNMYLYNDMLVVLGSVSIENNSDKDSFSSSKRYTFVSAYKKGSKYKEPELINTYYQEGSFNDVRITPDGYMYLITNGGFRYRYWGDYYINDIAVYKTEPTGKEENSFDEDSVKEQIPASGTNEGLTPASLEDIYIPENIDDTYSSSYTIVGSLDLNSNETINKKDLKVITGYTGEIYCHESNLYLTHERYDNFYSKSGKHINEINHEVTEITRLSLSDGTITPEATGEVNGYAKDQFSMSEYDGCFRIVTTCDYNNFSYSEDDSYYFADFENKSERSNNVFVLDMNLNKIGEITHFAKDEMVKSVSFDGNIGYVVTFVQTDPLFAVDFSDPTKPVILDEYKIDGFSTYMQKWDDDHLLGFGKTVTNNVEDGYKLVMFDNSDPDNLKEVGIFEIRNDDYEKYVEIINELDFDIDDYDFYSWTYSEAAYDRKTLLIAPEKNLIGFPITFETYFYDNSENWIQDFSQYDSGYCFCSYEDGDFKLKNFLSDKENNNKYYYNTFNRALYIGDYVYMISENKIVSADIDTCTKYDEVTFSENDYSPNDDDVYYIY